MLLEHSSTFRILPFYDTITMTMNDLAPLPSLPLGRYRHYKGGEYEVLGVVRHSETLAPLVLYRPLYNETGLWVRPFAMFIEQIEIDGCLRPRFAPLDTTRV
jgi:hypothetical protein